MTQKANILSFNEVKVRGASAPRTVSSRRPSHASNFQIQPNNHSRYAQSSYAVDALHPSHASSSYLSKSSSGRFSGYSSGTFSRSGSSRSSNYSNKSVFGHNWDVATSFSGQDKGEPSWLRNSSKQNFSKRSNGRFSERNFQSNGLRNTAGKSSRNTFANFEGSFDSGSRSSFENIPRSRNTSSGDSSHGGTQDASRRREVRQDKMDGFTQRMRKKFRSAKAERDFNRTIGARDRKAQTDAANTQASRAALYEMRMGSTHRKSARMQDDGNEKTKFGFSLPFPLSVASLSVVATRGIVALAVIGFTVFMLYPSCQNFYTETRQLQQLQAEYQALSDYNTQMQSQIDYLNTDEGLEEYARSELGWIRQDEHMATVEGVEPSTGSSTQTSTTYSPLNEDIPAPATWYSGVLDVLFGYGK